VIPDRIEAGTFLLAAAITRSALRITPVIPEHLGAVITKLEEAGCRIEHDGIGVTIEANQINARAICAPSPSPASPPTWRRPP
jgi:UDP-N-acetylglucosamine 1-carboxyvinyltransferase